jgi:hypothetical protein
MDVGANAQPVNVGATAAAAVTVNAAVLEPVAPTASFAITGILRAPPAVQPAMVIAAEVHVHVVPTHAPFVSAVVDDLPIAVRSAVTVLTLLLSSFTLQLTVVVVALPATTGVVVNWQPNGPGAAITGGTFNIVRVVVPVPVSNAVKLSFALIVMVFAPAAVPFAGGTSVTGALTHVVVAPDCTRTVAVAPPTALRSAVTAPAATVALTGVTTQVSVVVPVGVTELGENVQLVTLGAPAATFSVGFAVVVKAPASVAVTVGVYVVNSLFLAIVTPLSFHVVVVPC